MLSTSENILKSVSYNTFFMITNHLLHTIQLYTTLFFFLSIFVKARTRISQYSLSQNSVCHRNKGPKGNKNISAVFISRW